LLLAAALINIKYLAYTVNTLPIRAEILFNGLVIEIGTKKQNLPGLSPILEPMLALGKENGAFKKNLFRNIEIFSDNFDQP